MKRLPIIAFLLLTAIATHAAVPPLAFQNAAAGDSLYKEGNYASAIDAYNQVIAEGYTSPELYYNLAGAYYRTNQLGYAIVNYRRALQLKPNMSDARENLALAESRTVDRITPMPQFFTSRLISNLTSRLSPTLWRIITVLLLALVVLCLVGIRAAKSRSLRKTSLIAGGVLLLLWIASLLLMLKSSHNYNAHAAAVVVQQSVSIKSSPEQQATDKLVLHDGTTLTVSDSLSGWYRIRIADGTTGWCPTDAVERI